MKKSIQIHDGRSRYLLIGFVAILIISAVCYSFFSSNQMIKKYYPLVDATMEVKLEATTAHLWFEEIISGDSSENFEDIIEHIDQATWYARVMLEGGQNPEGTFLPLTDLVLRKEVAATVELLKEFKATTFQRHGDMGAAGIGSEIDQKYDRLFRNFIDQVDNVETLLQQKIREDYSQYHSLQIGLILSVLMAIFIAFLIQYKYEREQRDHIIEIRKAKDTAEENENWLKTIMNSMGDGVIITDHNGNVTYLNPVASVLTGWRLNEAKNKKMTEVFNIVNEQTKEPVDDPVNLVIRKNVVVGLANHTELISKDGKRWPIADSAAPIFDHEANLTGVVLVFHEVSAQKKAEEEKAQLEAQLRQVFKMEAIGTMAGGIAHDFNNILAIILGNADMALDDIPEESQAKYNVEQVLSAATRAKDLVKQILSFSRGGECIKKPYYLCHLVVENIKSLRSTIPTSVKVEVNIPEGCRNKVDDCEMMVLVDPTQIHQLLLNLCVNAVQAMDEKGILEISIDQANFIDEVPLNRLGLNPGVYEHLSVADTGAGIRPEISEKIFDPFFSTKEVGKGTGMGLSVVHGIVEHHGGNIFVESEPGKGTTFHVYFPATEEKPEEKLEEDGPLPTGNESILFVDDEEMLVNIGKDIIERQGYSVTAKADSVEALELFKSNPAQFDLVITDQTMPNMTGAEFAEQLLRLKPDLPIILCTGFSSKVDKVKAKQIGIKEFASKPLHRKDIARLIRKVLDA